MSYPKDLDEYTEAQLLEEIARRVDLREADLCDYCERNVTTPPCRFPTRHKKRRTDVHVTLADFMQLMQVCIKKATRKSGLSLSVKHRDQSGKNPGDDRD